MGESVTEATITNWLKNPGENVIMAIHQGFHPKARPLLHVELQDTYEKLKIDVKYFHKFDEFKNRYLQIPLQTNNLTLCIDEIDMEDITANELNQIQAKNLWVVIREPNIEKGEDPEAYIRKQFVYTPMSIKSELYRCRTLGLILTIC